MSERSVRKEIFLIEGIFGFYELPLRNKMNETILRSSVELQDFFYELGIENDLPNTWEEFKTLIVEFCTEESLTSVEKYKDESWSKYFCRLKDFAKIHKISEERIFKKLRGESLPSQLQSIFYSVGITFDIAFQRAKEYEEFKKSANNIIGQKLRKNERDFNINKRIKT
jgi:hypothetical protein